MIFVFPVSVTFNTRLNDSITRWYHNHYWIWRYLKRKNRITFYLEPFYSNSYHNLFFFVYVNLEIINENISSYVNKMVTPNIVRNESCFIGFIFSIYHLNKSAFADFPILVLLNSIDVKSWWSTKLFLCSIVLNVQVVKLPFYKDIPFSMPTTHHIIFCLW